MGTFSPHEAHKLYPHREALICRNNAAPDRIVRLLNK